METLATVGSRGFGGLPLRGRKLMRLIYLDEAGVANPANEPFVIVAGVAVNADRQFKEVEAHLDDMAGRHLSPEKRGLVAFHAMELFHGTKNFHRDAWPFEKRLEILDELASLPKKFDLPICWGATDRKETPSLLKGPVTPRLLEQINHAHAFWKFVTQMEILMRATANEEVGMLIAEDRDIMRKILKMGHAVFRGRAPKQFQDELEAIRREEIFAKLFPLERIVETVHFAQKTESSLLQIADISAFAIKRAVMKSSHWERLYRPLEGQILFKPDVVEALAASVQLS